MKHVPVSDIKVDVRHGVALLTGRGPLDITETTMVLPIRKMIETTMVLLAELSLDDRLEWLGATMEATARLREEERLL